MRRSSFALLLALLLCAPFAPAQSGSEHVTIDAHAAAEPFPHFWEQMFGSGRAILALRKSYQDDLDATKKITDFKYVRFHAILHDEVGVYDEDAQGNPVYNFSYVDQIYDTLLEHGVRPFVEISFMPKKLALRMDYHAFWYKQIVSPPKDYEKWDALVTAFAKHLIERYGIDEVSQWYFEVWNEPNIDFWTGRPAQQTYFELYDHTARALKAVDTKLRVGGPATAQSAWVDAMIAHASQNHVPLDFVSTHVYGNDVSQDVFGDKRAVPPHQMVCAAVDKVHNQIKASAMPAIPLIWSEFNATYMNQPEITDSIYMGPWMADTIRQCDGKVDMMSYWTFSDVFEEQGVIKTPFYGGYGLIAEGGIPKPAYHAFADLHLLGDERLKSDADNMLVTRRKDGTLVIAAWNLVEPDATGAEKFVEISFKGIRGHEAVVRRVDGQHGDVRNDWKQIGSPRYLTKAQVASLKEKSNPGHPETIAIKNDTLSLELPPNGLAVLEIR